jgi:cell division protein ZapA (FtsZ GTPase activity inhibitor)
VLTSIGHAMEYLVALTTNTPQRLPYASVDVPEKLAELKERFDVTDYTSIKVLTTRQNIDIAQALKNFGYTKSKAFNTSKVAHIITGKHTAHGVLRDQTCKLFHVLIPPQQAESNSATTKKRKAVNKLPSKNRPHKSPKLDATPIAYLMANALSSNRNTAPPPFPSGLFDPSSEISGTTAPPTATEGTDANSGDNKPAAV